jgi:hypothetical protein
VVAVGAAGFDSVARDLALPDIFAGRSDRVGGTLEEIAG